MAKVNWSNVLAYAFYIVMALIIAHFCKMNALASNSLDIEREAHITNQRALFFDWQDCNERARGDAMAELSCANEFYPLFKASREDIFKPN